MSEAPTAICPQAILTLDHLLETGIGFWVPGKETDSGATGASSIGGGTEKVQERKGLNITS